MRLSLLLILLALIKVQAATWYIDSIDGNDSNSGDSPEQAWQSLAKASSVKLTGGDQVLFRRGALWRGSLRPSGGSIKHPVLYSSYGSGAKPILQGSQSYSQPEQWQELRQGIWVTTQCNPALTTQIADLTDTRWTAWFQNNAKGRLNRAQEDGTWFNRLTVEHSSNRDHHLQLWGPQIRNLHSSLILRMRVKANKPFRLNTAEIMLRKRPWTIMANGSASQVQITGEWQAIEIPLRRQIAPSTPGYVHFNLGTLIPDNTIFDFDSLGLWMTDDTTCTTLVDDIGNIIFNHGKFWGVKRWTLDDLQSDLDYWHDPLSRLLYIRSSENPAKRFSSIELAGKRNIIDFSECNNITFDGLALRYGAAHGFGGYNTKRITIRNCDISWIGGGHQFTRADGTPVRYGNGIEFWNSAENHLIENNHLWQIYDAALTCQGNSTNSIQRNIAWRNNLIRESEFSFEMWHRPESAISEKIIFEYNTCISAGGGWAHSQRPDPNASHLMFYFHPAQSQTITVRNNIFAHTIDRAIYMQNDWRSSLTLNNNLYWTGGKPVMLWRNRQNYSDENFNQYQKDLNLDIDSTLAQPLFVDPDNLDFTLRSDSPGTTLATDGGPVGRR